MTQQQKGRWATVVAFSINIALGVAILSWMTYASTTQAPREDAEARFDQQLTRLEHEVTALTHAPEQRSSSDVLPQPPCPAAQASEKEVRQSLSTLIREELRQALAQWTPESQQAREETILDAQLRNTPENGEAYQSASAVVRAAIAEKRWTEENARRFREASSQLTKEQHQELLQLLLPLMNRGEIAMEGMGSLF
jgi:hypothetical protein